MDNCEGMAFATGEMCRLTGVYRPRCHPARQLELDEGEIFPPCGAGRSQRAAKGENVGSFWIGRLS